MTTKLAHGKGTCEEGNNKEKMTTDDDMFGAAVCVKEKKSPK